MTTELQELIVWAPRVTARTTEPAKEVQAFLLLRRCRESGDASLIPQLAQLAESCSESYLQLLAFEACDALFRLGAPADFFERHCEDTAERPLLAYYSMLTVARVPDAKRAAAFTSIAKRAEQQGVANAHLLFWAASRARATVDAQAALAGAHGLDQQVALLAASSIGGYSPFVSGHGGIESPTDRCDPLVAWSRAQLEQLARRAPADVAQALLSTRFNGFLDAVGIDDEQKLEELLNDYRDHASQFLTPDALAIYRLCRPPLASK